MLSYISAEVLPPQPPGRALGTFMGLQLGMGLQRSDVRLAFDPTLGRSVSMAYVGAPAGLSCNGQCRMVVLGLALVPVPTSWFRMVCAPSSCCCSAMCQLCRSNSQDEHGVQPCESRRGGTCRECRNWAALQQVGT